MTTKGLPLEFLAEESGDSIGFVGDFLFGEVDDAVAGCFEGEIGGAFIRISVRATGTVDLYGKPLLLPMEVDHHSTCAFGGHVPLSTGRSSLSP